MENQTKKSENSSTSANSPRAFKYYPEDFGALTVKVLHMDLLFDMFEDHTRVESDLKASALEEITELTLNAKNLEILKVQLNNKDCSYNYKKDEDLLHITFPQPIKNNEEFTISTESICRPTSNILEGLYYDETPKGCPCQQITQCQQWGFQRIVPCIDDMTAKCTYSTTIIADERYTNMISNGDLVLEKTSLKNNRAKIKYDNTVTPMATYLFFLGVGTYATFTRELEYPDGHKFNLELLVPPDSDPVIAYHALDVLHDAIIWVYLFTGRDKFKNYLRSREIKELIDQREEAKRAQNLEKTNKIRDKLKEKCHHMHFGYKYTGTVYREIGMQNSDFGGMENVGNTTITTNRIMPFPEMTDGAFEYMIRVKAHEYYHNLNGSEVTGRSPFEIWLNEAVTVFIEEEYHAYIFGADYARLNTVLHIISPGGTLAQDDSVISMPIEPDGFNDPNELITGVTYVKAPEFVRMVETLMGKETFVKALDLYHTRYKHSNASRAQWIEAMEEEAAMDFSQMAQTWLKQNGYPKVKITSEYNKRERTFHVHLEQELKEGHQAWQFPFKIALVDSTGEDIAEKMIRIDTAKESITFEHVPEPAFLSINREFSFFGKVFYDVTPEQLYLQVRQDVDVVNAYMAFHKLAEIEKMKLLKDHKAEPSQQFIELYFEILNNEDLIEDLGSSPLVIFEQVEDDEYEHDYQALYDAVKKIRKSIATKYEKDLIDIYHQYAQKKFSGNYTESQSNYIKARSVQNTSLGLLSELDSPEVHQLIKKQFNQACCATDKVIAFKLYLESSAADKMEILKEYQEEAKQSLVSWESFLAVVGGNNSNDALDIIREVEKSPNFRIDQANDQRALYGSFARNRKKSLLTKEGRQFMQEKIAQLAPINEYNTLGMLRIFGNIDLIDREHQAELIKTLKNAQAQLDPKEQPSVYNNINRILQGSPKAMAEYESKA